MSLSDLFKDLDPSIGEPLEKVTEALRDEIRSQIDGVRSDVQGLVSEGSGSATASGHNALDELKHATSGIDSSSDQAAILTALLEGAGRFSSRSAFFLLRDEGARCWGSLGFDENEDSMRGEVVPANGDSAWSRIRDGAGTLGLNAEDCAVFCSHFEAPVPTMGALFPLSLGDHVAGCLYADQLNGDSLNLTALQLLTFVAGQTLETLPVRKRRSTPALIVAALGAPAVMPEPIACSL